MCVCEGEKGGEGYVLINGNLFVLKEMPLSTVHGFGRILIMSPKI